MVPVIQLPHKYLLSKYYMPSTEDLMIKETKSLTFHKHTVQYGAYNPTFLKHQENDGSTRNRTLIYPFRKGSFSIRPRWYHTKDKGQLSSFKVVLSIINCEGSKGYCREWCGMKKLVVWTASHIWAHFRCYAYYSLYIILLILSHGKLGEGIQKSNSSRN